MERRALLAGLAAGTTTALAGCTDAGSLFGDPVQETRDQYFDVPDGARIRVENENGDVAVTGRDKPEASVDATVTAPGERRLDDVTVSVSEDGDEIAVTADVDGDASRVSVDLDLRVPEAAAVAPVQMENGDVEVRGVSGVAAARSVNGNVTVRDAGPVSSVSSANGDVAVDVPAPLPGDVLVRSENGDVGVALSADVDATLAAQTETNYVEIDGLELQNRSGDDADVTGTLGDGTHDVTVETANGAVEIRALE
ncbi:DUF4097 family beta strand repeat-containing protein [Halobacterium sp. R2-5]|uniref:DUF4097 family beta strand repeat-containing protein n=1 Tax=Halobacterium sp. R2-5 TaxID=2715751 RepID=UPI001420F9CC|nr:DUF4097 family beta strand repeat-containing protein [Halobacterium sp. R2-5]NIB99657.1 DUF4097 domain-containing protein [Halobacterium sp. R2-5]